ncbi:MAG: sigma 54-interacting transcriptional regulator [Bacteroidia bacterium]|nr:sigma 54-interacting transcriptional regulator [Bacteroidia bacterium]
MDETHQRHDGDEAVLRALVHGTAAETGEDFFRVLVRNLAMALGTSGAWVTEYLDEARRLRALAFWHDGSFVPHYEYEVAGTPCEPVIRQRDVFHVPDRVIELFPDDPDLPPLHAVSYRGAPLLDVDGSVLGHLAILNDKPMPERQYDADLFRIFAARAAAELRRLRAEAQLREREQQLNSLLDAAMDAIIEIDGRCNITQANPAAEHLFQTAHRGLHGRAIRPLLSDESREKLDALMTSFATSRDGRQSLWIPGGLTLLLADGNSCQAEATLSRHLRKQHVLHVLILRNIRDRLDAEKRINALTAETEYLRGELRAMQNFDEIIGETPALLRVLHQMRQVAATDATVLVLGETGTGKELIARGIHNASKRKDGPLIKLNCAAIPAALIESELFGHEKGAFTGATAKRDGRFVLADGGSIFLDEIGELPLELQAKLLRVLQEGEVEAVGSAHTVHVNVRVIAATNRDLRDEVAQGRFREDLFYRLNVFPIRVPSLRERRDDIAMLAGHFVRKASQSMGIPVDDIAPEDVALLRSYDWPGNIRELQNIIERAVITSREGRLNFARIFPEANGLGSTSEHTESATANPVILNYAELKQIEKENILRALEHAGGKIAGHDGAAALLGVPSTTLASRVKALGIRPPKRRE